MHKPTVTKLADLRVEGVRPSQRHTVFVDDRE
jgi:hypothetical protein